MLDPYFLLLFPDALFWMAATLRFMLIKDVGETSLRLQQSQSHTYLIMSALIALAVAQAYTAPTMLGQEITIACFQALTYAVAICLTRMHQTRNMQQPSYCIPLFVWLSLMARFLIVLLTQYATIVEAVQLALFVFWALI